MSEKIKLLVLEDNPADAELEIHALQRAGFDLTWQRVETQADFLAALDSAPDIILADYNLPLYDGFTALQQMRARGLDIPFIIVSGAIGEELAVSAIQEGAMDYLLKDRLARLGAAVTAGLEKKKLNLQKREADKQREASFRRFQALIEHSAEAIALVSATGTIFYQSPAAMRILGYRLDELLGRTALEFVHPDDLAETATRLAQLLEQPEAIIATRFRTRHKDGSWRWIEVAGSNLLDEPAVEGIVLNYHDVTERKQAEDTVLQERILLRTVIDNLPNAIYVMDTAARKILSNRADLENIGKPAEEVMGKTDLELFPSEVGARLYADDQVVLQERQPIYNLEELLVNAGGTSRWLQTTKLPLYDSQAQLVGLVGISYDITEDKQTAEKIKNQLTELERWQDVMLGREDRVAQLKREVNALCLRAGEPPHYPSQTVRAGEVGKAAEAR